MDRIGFCSKVSWNVRWLGSSSGGAEPGSGRSAPNGKLWQRAWMIRLAEFPRRNGWRAFALTFDVARPPGGRSTMSSLTVTLSGSARIVRHDHEPNRGVALVGELHLVARLPAGRSGRGGEPCLQAGDPGQLEQALGGGR